MRDRPTKDHDHSDYSSEEFQNFETWQRACEHILAKPFPPSMSDFSAEELNRDRHLTFSKMTNWEIICQEILDTEFSHIYYQNCYRALVNRGKTEQDIFEMRKLAWLTAGWLNFPMMAWEWVNLGELHIRRAIQWLYDRKEIGTEQRAEFEGAVKRHAN